MEYHNPKNEPPKMDGGTFIVGIVFLCVGIVLFGSLVVGLILSHK